MRTKQVFAVLLVSLLVLSALSFTGCVEDDGEENGDGNGDEVKDTLHIGYVGEPKSFHPITYTAGQETGQFLQQIFDPLLTTFPDGEPTTEGHAVAESYDVSDDGLTYSFTLEEGIKFHNGEELNAEDVVFTMYTIMIASDNDTYFDMYDVDTNLDTVRQKGYADFVKDIEATGEYTLEIHMKKRMVEFLVSDAFLNTRIVPKDYIEDNGWDTFADTLIGTGPYKFVHYKKGDEIRLEAFEDAHLPAQEIKTMIINYYDEESSAITALRSGDLDYIPDVEEQAWLDLKATADNVVAESAGPGGTMYVTFNFREGPTTDVRVRKAIAYAIDVDEIIQGISTPDLVQNERSLLPPDHPGYPDDLEMYDQDLDKARELLDEAGYTGDTRMTLSFYGWTASQQPMPIIQNQLAEVGIDVEITTVEWGGFIDAMKSARPDMIYTGWPGAASAEYMMGWLSQNDPFIHWNLFYNSSAFTEKFNEAMSTVDDDERYELLKEAQRIVVDDEMGQFVLWQEEDPLAYSSDLDIPEEHLTQYADGTLHGAYSWTFKSNQ